MSEALSIRAAADESPAVPALRWNGASYSFAALAEKADARLHALNDARDRARPYPLVAASDLDTVVTLLALLEGRMPVLLLHPRLVAAERDALVSDVSRAGRALPADAAVIIHTSGTTGTPRAAAAFASIEISRNRFLNR